jgi:Kelch motif
MTMPRFYMVAQLKYTGTGFTKQTSSTNTWSVKSTMPTPRWKLTSSATNGKIYTIGGGATGNQCVPTGTVEEYTPSSNTWASKNAMPTARWGAASVAVNGQIYVLGGSRQCPQIIVSPSSALEVYDPVTNIWVSKTSMPTARWDLAAAAVNGKIYAIGGWDPQSAIVLKNVEEYDLTTDTWTTKAAMPTARTGLVATAINGPRSWDRPLYAFRGGLSGAGASSTDAKIAANIERGFCPKKRSAAVVPSGRVRKKL